MFLDCDVSDLLRLDGGVLDAEPVEHQFPAVLFHGNEDLVHVFVGQSDRFIDREEASQLFQLCMLVRPHDALSVEYDIPKDPEIAHGVTADFVDGNALGLREPWTNLVFPVREQEDDYRPRMLLFVGASWSVDGEVDLNSDNPIVDHVGLRRIFVAGPDDHLPSRIVDLGPDWSIDSMNLTLNAGVVSSEPGEGVHVRPDLLVHEVDVLFDDVVKASVTMDPRASNAPGELLPEAGATQERTL